MSTPIDLLKTWRRHIADVYVRRGRADVYMPLEVLHTCHGCGGYVGRPSDGLCDQCQAAYDAAAAEQGAP